MAWNIGRELADHPQRQLFASGEHPSGDVVEWDETRSAALRDLGDAEFFDWIRAGGMARDLELQQTT